MGVQTQLACPLALPPPSCLQCSHEGKLSQKSEEKTKRFAEISALNPFFFFLCPHLWSVEIPWLGVELEL